MKKIDITDKRTQNILLYLSLLLLLIISNLYIHSKITKVRDIFNPYLFLFILNIDIIFLLIIIGSSFKYLIKVFFEKGITGKLRVKLFIILTSLVVIPSALLFTVSVSLISSATNLWFSGKVGSAIGKVDEIVSYNLITNQEWLNKIYTLIYKGEITPENAYKNFGLSSLGVFSRDLQLQEYYGESLTPSTLQMLEKEGTFIVEESVVLSGLLPGDRKVLIVYRLPNYFLLSKEEIKVISDVYSEFKYYKAPIRIGYILMLLTITVSVIFAGFWFSRFIARQITYPLEELTKAVDRLSQGDLSVKVNLKSSDEVGILIKEFNRMVDHLGYLYQKLQDKNQTLKKNKDYLEAILDNIKTGVLYSSPEGVIENINKSAVSIVGEELSQLKKRNIEDLNKMISIDLRSEDEQILELSEKTLLVKVKHINQSGYVIVIEDITHIILAQKLNTWKEIAQRIAHEIKNPLTPIKLSAERIMNQYKKSNPNLGEIIEKSVKVILTEVEHLSNLVRDFSQFGRSFTDPEFTQLNLCEILREIISMYNFEDFSIELNCEEGIYITGDKKLLKQAFSNIIQNSLESASKLQITTRRFDGGVVIEFLDNGPGILPDQLEKVFLPYYSKKPKGSGLGLTIAKEIVQSHKGSIKAMYNKDGANIVIKLPGEENGSKEDKL